MSKKHAPGFIELKLYFIIYAFKHALAGWKKAIKAEKLVNCPK